MQEYRVITHAKVATATRPARTARPAQRLTSPRFTRVASQTEPA